MTGRLRWVGLLVLAGLFSVLAAVALAHTSGCHSAHSCPSDHHTYVWYDAGGQGWDCVKSGAPEYNPATDTTTITYDGYTYYCAAPGSIPRPTTTTPTPTNTT